jgi:hypothetical protein
LSFATATCCCSNKPSERDAKVRKEEEGEKVASRKFKIKGSSREKPCHYGIENANARQASKQSRAPLQVRRCTCKNTQKWPRLTLTLTHIGYPEWVARAQRWRRQGWCWRRADKHLIDLSGERRRGRRGKGNRREGVGGGRVEVVVDGLWEGSISTVREDER